MKFFSTLIKNEKLAQKVAQNGYRVYPVSQSEISNFPEQNLTNVLQENSLGAVQAGSPG